MNPAEEQSPNKHSDHGSIALSQESHEELTPGQAPEGITQECDPFAQCAPVSLDAELADGQEAAVVQREYVEKWKAQLQAQPDVESKVNCAISFMETALSQNGAPNFREFWEARKLCLDLFKEEALSSTARFQLWNKYIELSKEARRLKEILDEQSAFAAEQIDIAIQALEQELVQLPELLAKNASLEFSEFAQVLGKDKLQFYSTQQNELNFLNVYASRINALRKELIKTEMRIRQKNKLFQRLSTTGDQVFPRRKELIKDVSQRFIDDIEAFIQSNFAQEEIRQPLFALREEIKALQSVAKILTLNTISFTQTRKRLSECWDKIKILEKERKKERAIQKVAFKEHVDQVQQKLNELRDRFTAGTLTSAQGQDQLEEILAFMRSQRLGRDELQALRDQVNDTRKLFFDKIKADEQNKLDQENEKGRLKQEKLSGIRRSVETLCKEAEGCDFETLTQRRDTVMAEVESSGLNRNEKQELEKLLRSIRDILADKKKKALLALSTDDQQVLAQLTTMLNETKQTRQEVKDQLEALRKGSGHSGFDFQQALVYNEQLNTEKQRLEKINQSIKELEQKIAKFEL